ncbi:MAG: hypothetical protein ACFB0G_25475 [Leptolyngbyaceae cyanobacterium]
MALCSQLLANALDAGVVVSKLKVFGCELMMYPRRSRIGVLLG